MAIVAIDIGTTHCKAGLIDQFGSVIKIASHPMLSHKSAYGWNYYKPDEVLRIISQIIHEITLDFREDISAVGIASMAETGLLVNRNTGEILSDLIPWFETASQPMADMIHERSDPVECYLKYGLKVSFKSSLAKILWLKQEGIYQFKDAVWLSAADFAAYSLSGIFATDYSLAGRTLAFQVEQKQWDRAWLKSWGFSEDLFPNVFQAGYPIGTVNKAGFGLQMGIPVSICGHDHVCAALAMGAVAPGVVFDSMGTAETLIGALPERPLTRADYENGLQYGCHVAEGLGYWMGGLSASGGSIEWIRLLMPPPSPSYSDLENLLNTVNFQPSGILYFPYLLGSGSPHTDPKVRGALIGLTSSHRSEDLIKAVLEGTAFELEFIRQAGERMSGISIPTLVAAGGGTRYRVWSQIKANVSGCQIDVSAEPEATLLGAALAAGIGIGLYENVEEVHQVIHPRQVESFFPDEKIHQQYQDLYHRGFLMFQEPLRKYVP